MNFGWHNGTRRTQNNNGTRALLRARNSVAFTLLELMLVVAILAIALAFSYPAIRDDIRRAPLGQAVKDVTDACRQARAQAILTGHAMELRIRPADMSFEVAQVADDTMSGGAQTAISASSAAAGTAASQEAPAKAYVPPSPFISSGQVSPDVRIEMLDVNFTAFIQEGNIEDDGIAHVHFYPNGTCDDMTLIMSSAGEFRKISLEAVTGLSMIESDPTKFTSSD